jgi:GDP-D-mannose 3',5'-epimerase
VGTACSFPKELQHGVNSAPLREVDQFPASPESAYGWSKLMGELDANYLQKYANIPAVILVLHNVYGSPCDFSSNRAQVVPSLIYKALLCRKSGGNLDVWGDGSQGRAFIHVNDVVKGLISSLNYGHGEGAIQLGPEKCTSIREVAEKIVARVDNQISIKYDVTKPTGDLGRSANYSKATKILNWYPAVDFDYGLNSLIEWIDNRMKI